MRHVYAVLIALLMLAAACTPEAARPPAPSPTPGLVPAQQPVALAPLTPLNPSPPAPGTAPSTQAQSAAVKGTGPRAPDYWPTDGWRTSAPDAQDVDPAKLTELFAAIDAQRANLHSKDYIIPAAR